MLAKRPAAVADSSTHDAPTQAPDLCVSRRRKPSIKVIHSPTHTHCVCRCRAYMSASDTASDREKSLGTGSEIEQRLVMGAITAESDAGIAGGLPIFIALPPAVTHFVLARRSASLKRHTSTAALNTSTLALPLLPHPALAAVLVAHYSRRQ